jgi:8-oxo-dGTP pyrophosphatase MutT (NUDIX family)
MARGVDQPAALTGRGTRELSAGGLVYRIRDEATEVVLAGRRHPATGALLWSLPKGHVEAGETPAAAAVREVREETGLVARIERPLGDVTYSYVREDRRVPKRVVFFLMCATGGRFADRDHELDDVRWVPLNAAVGMMAHANERALVRRARRPLSPG